MSDTKAPQPYKPELDFRLKLEISGANITIEDSPLTIYKGLDMDFHIIKSYLPDPQESTIKIYNLSTSTYNKIYENAKVFRLSSARGLEETYTPFFIGYGVSNKKVAGKTILTRNQGFMAQDANAGRKGQNDLVTELKLKGYGFAKLYKSYRKPVSTNQIIDDCRMAIGLPKGNMDKIKEVTKPAGYSIRGEVSKTLNKLGNELGFYWNANDMFFNIYSRECKPEKTYGIVLNPSNSSTPERLSDKFTSDSSGKKDAKKYTITRVKQGFMVETMLLPFLQVGHTCHLDFDMADAKGDKYIYKLEHIGSNVGTSCVTRVYCV